MNKRSWPPKQAYDLFAGCIESWIWYGLWQQCERPHVLEWLSRTGGLDAGCGTAPYLEVALSSCETYVGADVSGGMLRVAQRRTLGHDRSYRLSFMQADVRHLPFAPNSFDWILCTRVLSHVSMLDQAVREIAYTLRPRGKLLLTDVHALHPYDKTRLAVGEKWLYVEAYKHPTDKLLMLMKQAGMYIEQVTELRLRDLDPPPNRVHFRKLYESDDPYLLILIEAEKRLTSHL